MYDEIDSHDAATFLQWSGYALIVICIITVGMEMLPVALLQPVWLVRFSSTILGGGGAPALTGVVLLVIALRFDPEVLPLARFQKRYRQLARLVALGFLLLLPLQMIAGFFILNLDAQAMQQKLTQLQKATEVISKSNTEAVLIDGLSLLPAAPKPNGQKLSISTPMVKTQVLAQLNRQIPLLQTRISQVRKLRVEKGIAMWFKQGVISAAYATAFWMLGSVHSQSVARQGRYSLALAYHPSGFGQRGGIQRLAINVAQHLRQRGAEVSLLTASTSSEANHPPGFEGLSRNRRLQELDSLVIFGCNQPWAYGLVLKALLHPQGPRIHWLPSFHDPRWVAHPIRARLAQVVLKLMQPAGVTVHGQTQHEVGLLNGGRCRLSRHGLSDSLRQHLQDAVADTTAQAARPLDLLFLGRPTVQKGWPRFLSLARRCDLRCGAIVPFLPPDQILGTIELVLNPSDEEIPCLLRRAKIVLIPADYESFGIAQLEALAQGCIVPILGQWPLWDSFEPLQWQNLNEEELGAACVELCHNTQRRSSLVEQQLAYLRCHPIQAEPFLFEHATAVDDG